MKASDQWNGKFYNYRHFYHLNQQTVSYYLILNIISATLIDSVTVLLIVLICGH